MRCCKNTSSGPRIELLLLRHAGGYNYGTFFGGDGLFMLDIAFPLAIIAMFFFCLLTLLSTINKRLQARHA